MKKNRNRDASNIGLVVWFRPGKYQEVEEIVKDCIKMGISQIRTGISWAEWHKEETREWFDWLFPALAKNLELLPCFLYTPPSLGENPEVSSPPKNLKGFADFIDVMITRYGQYFEWVELWNEPNNVMEYDYTMDYSWNKFATMIGMAAYWAQQKGKKTLLGGMSPIDPNWLQYMIDKDVLKCIDAIGIHGFPHVFDQHWTNWENKISAVRNVLKKNNLAQEIWITEAGFSTWQHDEVKQWKEFKKAINADADRIYWYGYKDLDPRYSTVGGMHLDEREYYFGMKKTDGTPKLLYNLLMTNGVENINSHSYIHKQYEIKENEKYTLITGGAGFIGINLAARLLSEGRKVMIYDNISRKGVDQNLMWLKENYGENLKIQIADVLEKTILEECVKNAEQVYHFSAQVAVTSSLVNPQHDLNVNIIGTFNLLEAIRKSPHQPPLIFTSTNKVYGNLQDIELVSNETRYYPKSKIIENSGVNESRTLDFHSPYGCSKGAAEQYVLDYARSYGLKTAVFRMSCIYGPHQFGTEDQGWVAHFIIRALEEKPITIYGDGKQVRDILFVEDLVDAFLTAEKNMDKISGQAFNIGGGPENTVSLLELIHIINEFNDKEVELYFDEWRTGDQQYYVSNTQKFKDATGWKPKFSVHEGIETLVDWLSKQRVATIDTEVAAKSITA